MTASVHHTTAYHPVTGLPDTGSADADAIRLQFEHSAIWNRMVSAGDRVPAAPLIEVDWGPIHLERLCDTGPVVLVFFRSAASPECDAALRAYQYTLAPALDGLDAHLLAVSPQAPRPLSAIKRRHDLGFLVASDPRHTLIDAFNIGFTSPGAEQILGTGRSVLPFAAVVVADRTGRVRFTEVHADWSTRTAPGRIIRAVGRCER